MLYQQLCDNVFDWLMLATGLHEDETPVVDWNEGDQPLLEPIPEDLPAYGFYRVMSIENKDMGATAQKYNGDNDNFDLVSYDYQSAQVTIDIYTTLPVKNLTKKRAPTETVNPLTPHDIANMIYTFANTPQSIEFLQQKNMGYMKRTTAINQVVTSGGVNVRKIQFDIIFSVIAVSQSTVERIVTAPVTSDIEGINDANKSAN